MFRHMYIQAFTCNFTFNIHFFYISEASVYIDPRDIVTRPSVDGPNSVRYQEVDSKFVKVEDKKGGLSHGAYAGIACSLLFIGIIALLIFIAVRKK